MDLGIAGRVAVVTGGASRMDFEVGRFLAEAGAKMSDRAPGILEAKARGLRGLGQVRSDDVAAHAANLTEAGSIDRPREPTAAAYGPAGILTRERGASCCSRPMAGLQPCVQNLPYCACKPAIFNLANGVSKGIAAELELGGAGVHRLARDRLDDSQPSRNAGDELRRGGGELPRRGASRHSRRAARPGDGSRFRRRLVVFDPREPRDGTAMRVDVGSAQTI